VLAISCVLNVPATASACPSSTTISPAPGSRPILAYAHSVLAMSCVLNVLATASVLPSSTLISPAPGSRPILAYAHSVLDINYVLNVPVTDPTAHVVTSLTLNFRFYNVLWPLHEEGLQFLLF
jgi:hypothetical protein